MPTTQELLDSIDIEIAALIANPEVDHTDGDYSAKDSQKMDQLLKAREQLLQHPDAEITQIRFDNNVSIFGEDDTEYV